MRKLILIILSMSLLIAINADGARRRTMSVQIREAHLRAGPGFLSRVVTTLPYAQHVIMIEQQGDWIRVHAGEEPTEGWMHHSALTTRRLTLSGDGDDVQQTVTSDEQALAGRGFSAEVESEFKSQQKDANFEAVDQMESIRVDIEDIIGFLNAGGLTLPTGGKP